MRYIPGREASTLSVGIILLFVVWFKDTQWTSLVLNKWITWIFPVFVYLGLLLIVIATVSTIFSIVRPVWQGWTYRRKYPRNQLGSRFQLVGTKEIGHKVWIIEKTRRWVGNTATFHGLHFYYDDIEELPPNFNEYKDGKIIVIDGSPGLEPANVVIEREEHC